MGGAGQARVIGADGGFDAVQHAFADLRSLHVGLCHAVNCVAHRPIVVTGGNDKIHFQQFAVFIGGVIVDERAARSFDNAHAVSSVVFAGVEDIGTENIRIVT